MPSQKTNCDTPHCHVSVSEHARPVGLEKQAGRSGELEGDVTEEEEEDKEEDREECD